MLEDIPPRESSIHSQCRNRKSLKFLRSQLEDYNSEPRMRKSEVSTQKLIRTSRVKKNHLFDNEENEESVFELTEKEIEMNQIIVNIFIHVTDNLFKQKSQALVDTLLLNL